MKNLEEVLSRINNLLRIHSEYEWGTTFDFFLNRLEEGDAQSLKRDIRSIYDGMGSFNDLVLYKGGVPTNNNELDGLRKELFKVINQP